MLSGRRGTHRLETGPNFSPGPRDNEGRKVLRFDPDLLEHEVELQGDGPGLPFGTKAQKVTIAQLQSVASWELDIIDQSLLAVVVLQANRPVISLELSKQLCMDPREEARLLLGLWGHFTQVRCSPTDRCSLTWMRGGRCRDHQP